MLLQSHGYITVSWMGAPILIFMLLRLQSEFLLASHIGIVFYANPPGQNFENET
jgi:hypothetical protein